MKLLHLIPALKPGGPVQALKALLHHFRHWQHTVLALEPEVRGKDLIELMSAGAKVLRGPDAAAPAAAIDSADVVLVHAYNHPMLISVLAGPLPDARWVVWFKVLGRRRPQQVFPERLDPGVFCVFTAASDVARAGGWPMIPSMVRPEFVDLTRRPHRGVVVDYIGSTNTAKLHRGTIRFLAELRHPDLRIRIHGGPLAPEMQDDLARAHAPERFEVGGFTSDVPGLLATSDIFVTPMAAESYASSDLALQEAMHAGLAPVVLGRGGPADMITDGVDGRVTETGETFTAAVQALCDDAVSRDRMGEAARETARNRFDPVVNAGRMGAALEARAGAAASPFGYTARQDLPPAALYLVSQGWDEDTAVAALADARREQLKAFAADLDSVAARVEGGLIQWRNAFPDDADLLWMSAVWHEAIDAPDTARAEYWKLTRLKV